MSSLLESPDPDAAVEGLSHYVAARTGRAMFLDYLREDPRALHVLTYVMGASPAAERDSHPDPGVLSLARRAGRAQRPRSPGS